MKKQKSFEEKLVLFGLALFIIMWSVCSAIGISSFGSWIMPILAGVAIVVIIVPDFFPEKWKVVGPYPLKIKDCKTLLDDMVCKEKEILGLISFIKTMFFPVSIFFLVKIVLPLTSITAVDPDLVMRRDAEIVTGILIMLMSYVTVLIIGYLVQLRLVKQVDNSWEERKHLIWHINMKERIRGNKK